MNRRLFKQTITVQGMCSQSDVNGKKTLAAQVNVVTLLNSVTVGSGTPSGKALAKNRCLEYLLEPDSDIILPVINVRVSQCELNQHENNFDTLSFEYGSAEAVTANDSFNHHLSALASICNYDIELPEDKDEEYVLTEKDKLMIEAKTLVKSLDVVVVFIFES